MGETPKQPSISSKSLEAGDRTVILGGGLAGLAAGYVLARAGRETALVEAESALGGLSRTIVRGDLRFDLGGHRFFTTDEKVDRFVKELMGPELITVGRRSKIYLRKKYFAYPLKPANAVFGLGAGVTAAILLDYARERFRNPLRKTRPISLEDWVVARFGRKMFEIYFKEYSEKVWGLTCDRISAEWVAQRIRGLSLGVAVRSAFFKVGGRALPTLADVFVYPARGIGRVAARLHAGMAGRSTVLTTTRAVALRHHEGRIRSVLVENQTGRTVIEGGEFVSTIPLTALVGMLDPPAPAAVLAAAARLKYRDLVVVAVMVDRARITEENWIYFPEREIPFGRAHEPGNWSPRMVPPGKSTIVLEYFCFAGDDIWSRSDAALVDLTTTHLERLGFIARREVCDSHVVRVPKAYPLFEVGFRKQVEPVMDYLAGFVNLRLVGRSGLFRYYNIDHTIRSGIEAAEIILEITTDRRKIEVAAVAC